MTLLRSSLNDRVDRIIKNEQNFCSIQRVQRGEEVADCISEYIFPYF